MSVFDGIKAQNPNTTFAQGCTIDDKDPPDNTPADECGSDAGFAAAVAAAKAADQVVLALGESRGQSGEAAARSDIDLPGHAAGAHRRRSRRPDKPFVVVLFNGRPLTLTKVAAASPAILEAWFPGIEAGNAVADVLFGKVNPGGKLPVVVPAHARPGADLLQPRAHRAPVRRELEVQLALPRPAGVRPALPVRLRAELHDVHGRRTCASSTHSVSKNGTRHASSVDVTNTGDAQG